MALSARNIVQNCILSFAVGIISASVVNRFEKDNIQLSKNLKTALVATTIFSGMIFAAISNGYNLDPKVWSIITGVTALATLFISTYLISEPKIARLVTSIETQCKKVKNQMIKGLSDILKVKCDSIDSMKVWVNVDCEGKELIQQDSILKPKSSLDLQLGIKEIISKIQEKTGSGNVEKFKCNWHTVIKDKDGEFHDVHGDVEFYYDDKGLKHTSSAPAGGGTIDSTKLDEYFTSVLEVFGREETPQLDDKGNFKEVTV